MFTQVFDTFGIKYHNMEDMQHLLKVLYYNYTISVDLSGCRYCDLALDWNYAARYVDISLPGYIKCILHKFLKLNPTRSQHDPHK